MAGTEEDPENELGTPAEDTPREGGVDYVVEVDDASMGHGSRTLETFGKELFGSAFALYLRTKKTDPSTRLLKVSEGGYIYTPILGYVKTRPWGKPKAALRNEKGRFVIGWNRVEPIYKGKLYWRIETYERDAMLPGRVIVRSQVKPFRKVARRRRVPGLMSLRYRSSLPSTWAPLKKVSKAKR